MIYVCIFANVNLRLAAVSSSLQIVTFDRKLMRFSPLGTWGVLSRFHLYEIIPRRCTGSEIYSAAVIRGLEQLFPCAFWNLYVTEQWGDRVLQFKHTYKDKHCSGFYLITRVFWTHPTSPFLSLFKNETAQRKKQKQMCLLCERNKCTYNWV